MKTLLTVLALIAVVGCKSKQDASIVYDTSMMQQQTPPPQPQASANQPAEQPPAVPPTGVPKITGKSGDTVLTADGLKWIDTKIGKGKSPTISSTVTANYKGMLTNGTVFDQSKVKPLTIPLSNVIPGWQEGMQTMKVGGKRRLIVPSYLGYGAQGMGQIPPNAMLIFDVELLKVE